MNTIRNYDSRKPLSNYELGSVHAFLVDTSRLGNLRIDPNRVYHNHYETLTNAIVSNSEFFDISSNPSNVIRVVGVVVDRLKSSIAGFADQITVMFQTDTDDCILIKYPVRSQGITVKQNSPVKPVSKIALSTV